MKRLALVVLTLTACTDEQNVGNTYSLHQTRWTTNIAVGTSGLITADRVALDPAGDVIALGTLNGTADFGGGPFSGEPGPAYWISKRAGADGSSIWTLKFGRTPNGNFDINGLAVDSAGDVIIAGRFSGTQPFGDQTVSGPESMYVAKITPGGHTAWVRGFGATSNGLVRGLAVGADGRIYVSGSFTNTLIFPDGVLTSTADQPCFLAAFDGDASLRWGRQYPDCTHPVVASDGSVVMAVSLPHSMMLGDTLFDLTQVGQLVAITTSADGALVATHAFGEPGTPYVSTAITLDDHDRLLATSRTGSRFTDATFDFMLGANGQQLWAAAPVSGSVWENTIATNGHAVLTGGHIVDGRVDLGGGELVGGLYFAARDAHGHLIDTMIFGDPISGLGDRVTDLALAGSGAVAFTASLDEPIDFGAGVMAGPAKIGNTDAAVVIGLFGD